MSSDVGDRPLHEIYSRAFEQVVKEAVPWTVMRSCNRIIGEYTAQGRWLLTEVLRERWGFQGAVVSDWGAVTDRVASVAAGLDLQMPGDTAGDDKPVVTALTDGRLDQFAVNRAAMAVARTAAFAQAGERDVQVDFAAHHALAR